MTTDIRAEIHTNLRPVYLHRSNSFHRYRHFKTTFAETRCGHQRKEGIAYNVRMMRLSRVILHNVVPADWCCV